jgi:peroxiredoxin family protein
MSSVEVQEQAGTEFRLRELEAQVAALTRAGQKPAGMTFIAFSNDVDKLSCAFMLANAAAAMGVQVSMFFTFWALTALRRKRSFAGKSLIERLFTAMTPAGSRGLGSSKWNLLGAGRLLFRRLMRRRGMNSLESLIATALELNVRIVACEAVMGVMAVTRDELIEGVQFGGAAAALDMALGGTITLFV